MKKENTIMLNSQILLTMGIVIITN